MVPASSLSARARVPVIGGAEVARCDANQRSSFISALPGVIFSKAKKESAKPSDLNGAIFL
jgi:hypothetical protein